MKKQLLLGSALLAFAFASAQTAQNIPNESMLLTDTQYTEFEIVNFPEDGGEREHITTHEKNKLGADHKYVSNMYDGDAAIWAVKSEAEACYIVRFYIACKTDAPGSYGEFSLIDRATSQTVWEKRYDAAPVQTASYGFGEAELYIDEPIPAGEYLFKLVFHNENGPISGTFNCYGWRFEAREEIQEVNLATYCEPAEGGSISITPARYKFVAGTEVKAQAIPNTGYKFVGWDNGIDDPFTTNPYTFTIEEDVDLTANFEEVLMYSNIPGYVNFENTRLVGMGKVQYDSHQIKLYNPETEQYDILHGEPGQVPWLGDYRNNNTEEFEVKATQAGDYNFVFHWSLKTMDTETPSLTFELYNKADIEADATAAMPVWSDVFEAPEATKQWFQFKEHKFEGINLKEGSYILRIYFKEPVKNKYTINILDMKFGIGDNYGEDQDAVEVITIDEAKAVRAYNLQGIEVPADTKGLIIVDGKKVYNK